MQPRAEDNLHRSTAKHLGDTPREPLADELVVDRIRKGDINAFELLMRRYNQRLFRVVRGIVNNDHEAEDIVQDAYVRAYQHLDQFEGRAKFSTWLTKIAVNEASSRVRKLRRRHLVDPDDPENNPLFLDRSMTDASHKAGLSELRLLLAQEIDLLPTDLRIVFVLRLVEELSTSETAECLDLSEANVKTRLHRARILLRRQIDAGIGKEARQLYQFEGTRCDRIVQRVMRQLQALPRENQGLK